MGTKPDLLTVPQAAAELDLTPRRVRQLIKDEGILPAQKVGRDYLIRRSDLSKVPLGRNPGPKPKKGK